MSELPLQLGYVGVPPVKCQGIKTKLVPFIFSSIAWSSGAQGRWIEPFVGSGVVALNLAPERAILADTNKHIISLYKAIQSGELTASAVRAFLGAEGKKLARQGADHYYAVRERFNSEGAPLDFLFLNRSCFNGVMRFNAKGGFNVPFGHKPERFSQAYITKIANQINWTARQLQGKSWEFRVASWDEILPLARPDDFVYLDPPYIGRHTDYFNSWNTSEATRLADTAKALPCGFALSMWLENKYRRNTHVDECWFGMETRVFRHFYHVGSSEDYRAEMDEGLIIKSGYSVVAPAPKVVDQLLPVQAALPI